MDRTDIATAASTALYAVALEAMDHKEVFEPDHTWIEVMIGTVICTVAAITRLRDLDAAGRLTWERGAAALIRAWGAGGLPIIAWQLWQAQRRHQQLLAHLPGQHHANPPTPMAAERRVRPAQHRGAGAGCAPAARESTGGSETES